MHNPQNLVGQEALEYHVVWLFSSNHKRLRRSRSLFELPSPSSQSDILRLWLSRQSRSSPRRDDPIGKYCCSPPVLTAQKIIWSLQNSKPFFQEELKDEITIVTKKWSLAFDQAVYLGRILDPQEEYLPM